MDLNYNIAATDRGVNLEPDGTQNVIALFKRESRKNWVKSRLAGRDIYDDVDMIYLRVRPPFDETGSQVCHIVDDEHKKTFPREWAEYQKKIATSPKGTPLKVLSGITPATILNLASQGITTVESLADSGHEWSQQARAYMEADASKDAEIARLKAELEAARGGPKPPLEDPAEQVVRLSQERNLSKSPVPQTKAKPKSEAPPDTDDEFVE